MCHVFKTPDSWLLRSAGQVEPADLIREPAVQPLHGICLPCFYGPRNKLSNAHPTPIK